jgi:cold shock CspA family protein
MSDFRPGDRVRNTETKKVRYGTVIEAVRPHLTIRWDGEERPTWIHRSAVRLAEKLSEQLETGDRVQYDSDPIEKGTIMDIMYVVDWDNWGVEAAPSYSVKKDTF